MPTQPSSAPNSAPKSKNEVKSPVPEDLYPLNAFEHLVRASTPVLSTESIGHIIMILETLHDSSVDGCHSGKNGSLDEDERPLLMAWYECRR